MMCVRIIIWRVMFHEILTRRAVLPKRKHPFYSNIIVSLGNQKEGKGVMDTQIY